MTGKEWMSGGLGNGVNMWGVMCGACFLQLFILKCFFCLLLLLLQNSKNTNKTRDFIQVMQQGSAGGNFLVVSRVGR